jgi:hypothetical protein
MCWAEACAVGGALSAYEPLAFRTVVTYWSRCRRSCGSWHEPIP